MKKIWHAVVHHFRSEVNLAAYGVALALLAVLFVVNYHFDLEDDYIDQIASSWWRWTAMFLLHAIPYMAVCAVFFAFKLNRKWIRMRSFWVFFFFGFAILALDRTLDFRTLLQPLLPDGGDTLTWEGLFRYRVISKFSGALTIVVPLLLWYRYVDRAPAAVRYGLNGNTFDLKPYAILLLVAAVIVGIGIQFSDIQQFYPKYARSGGEAFAQAHSMPEWCAVVVFQLAYGFDFLSTEFFFRGFLVLGMYRFLGPQALLPMAASYAALHFGKPLTEAMSSVAGGYLLGILALHHKNIWGGLLIHVGMAWMMEIAGWLAS